MSSPTTHEQVGLVVPGQPQPWERARRNGNRYFLAPRSSEFRDRVVTAWRVEGRPTLDGQLLKVDLLFVFAHAPSNLKKDGTPRAAAPVLPYPDLDNLAKGVLDALNGLLYDDDSQVARLSLGKRFLYPAHELEPRTDVSVMPWGPDVGT